MENKLQHVGFAGEDCSPLYKFTGTRDEFEAIQLQSENSSAVSYSRMGNFDNLDDRSAIHGGQPFSTFDEWHAGTDIQIYEIDGAIGEAESELAGIPAPENWDLKTEEQCSQHLSSNDQANGGSYGTALNNQGAVFKPFG